MPLFLVIFNYLAPIMLSGKTLPWVPSLDMNWGHGACLRASRRTMSYAAPYWDISHYAAPLLKKIYGFCIILPVQKTPKDQDDILFVIRICKGLDNGLFMDAGHRRTW
jgi:hypothetical protein